MQTVAQASVAAALCVSVLAAGASATVGANTQSEPGGRLGINGPILRENCTSPKGNVCRRIVPDGKAFASEGNAFASVDSLKFVFGAELLSEHDLATTSRETVRFALPDGLRWAGPGRPVPPSGWSFEPDSEACNATGQVATCQVDGVPSGTQVFAWLFDVSAERSGYYTLEVKVDDAGANRPPREHTPEVVHLKVLVRAGGDAVAGPLTTTVILLNAKSRSGAEALRVTALLRKGGLPVSPSVDATCTAAIAGTRLTEKEFAWSGTHGAELKRGYGYAFCDIFLAPKLRRKYAGKPLTGTISFKVGRTKVTRRYSTPIVARGPWIANPPPQPGGP
jgi:hypothetical protein